MVVYTFNLSIQEMEVGRSLCEFKAGLIDTIRPCLKKIIYISLVLL